MCIPIIADFRFLYLVCYNEQILETLHHDNVEVRDEDQVMSPGRRD